MTGNNHVLVDRYLHSAIAYHDQGRTLTPPVYDDRRIIKADVTIHITCGEDERVRRRLIRGFHIYERPDAEDSSILAYFRGISDFQFRNDVEISSSVQSFCERISEWLTKNVDALRQN